MIMLWISLLILGSAMITLFHPKKTLVRIVPVTILLLSGIGLCFNLWNKISPGLVFSDVIFGIAAITAIVSAYKVITHPEPLYSALYFILLVVATAILVLLLGGQFLAAALVLIYAGAIIVVYLFTIMFAQSDQPESHPISSSRLILGTASAVIFATIIAFPTMSSRLSEINWSASNVSALGHSVLVDNVIATELAGVLLLTAIIGGITLARLKPSDSEGES